MDPRAATNKLRVPFFKLARGITRATLAYPAIMIGFYTHTQNRDSDTLRLAYPLAENRDGLKIKSSMDETYKIGPQYNNMGYEPANTRTKVWRGRLKLALWCTIKFYSTST